MSSRRLRHGVMVSLRGYCGTAEWQGGALGYQCGTSLTRIAALNLWKQLLAAGHVNVLRVRQEDAASRLARTTDGSVAPCVSLARCVQHCSWEVARETLQWALAQQDLRERIQQELVSTFRFERLLGAALAVHVRVHEMDATLNTGGGTSSTDNDIVRSHPHQEEKDWAAWMLAWLCEKTETLPLAIRPLEKLHRWIHCVQVCAGSTSPHARDWLEFFLDRVFGTAREVDAEQRQHEGAMSWRSLLGVAGQVAQAFAGSSTAGADPAGLELPLALAENAEWKTTLDYAAAGGQTSVMNLLYGVGARTSRFATINACMHGHLSVVEWLNAHGAVSSEVAVDHACANGHLPVVEFLMQRTSCNGCTAEGVERAAENGHLTILRYLSEKAPHAVRYWHARVVDSAAAHGQLDCVEFLCLERGFGCTNRGIEDAARNGHTEVLRFLHSAQGAAQWTPLTLQHAACRGHLGVVEFILKTHPANAPDLQVQRAIVSARRFKHENIVRYLTAACDDATCMPSET